MQMSLRIELPLRRNIPSDLRNFTTRNIWLEPNPKIGEPPKPALGIAFGSTRLYLGRLAEN
jgi:hypothetical protein